MADRSVCNRAAAASIAAPAAVAGPAEISMLCGGRCRRSPICRTRRISRCRQLGQDGHTFGHEHSEIEHSQSDRDSEQPSVHVVGNPVETDQALLHRKPRIWFLRSPIKYGAILLHRNMHIRKVLYELTLCAIAPRRALVSTSREFARAHPCHRSPRRFARHGAGARADQSFQRSDRVRHALQMQPTAAGRLRLPCSGACATTPPLLCCRLRSK
jgi:hypothetical protein